MARDRYSEHLDSTASYVPAHPFDFQALLEAWQEEFVFFRVDAAKRIEYISRSVRTILGYEPGELAGRDYREFFDPNHRLCDQLRDLSGRLLAPIRRNPNAAWPNGATASTCSSSCASECCTRRRAPSRAWK